MLLCVASIVFQLVPPFLPRDKLSPRARPGWITGPAQVWDFSLPASGFLPEVIPGIFGETLVELLPFPLSVECGSWVVP